jgi:hypothetical protein
VTGNGDSPVTGEGGIVSDRNEDRCTATCSRGDQSIFFTNADDTPHERDDQCSMSNSEDAIELVLKDAVNMQNEWYTLKEKIIISSNGGKKTKRRNKLFRFLKRTKRWKKPKTKCLKRMSRTKRKLERHRIYKLLK